MKTCRICKKSKSLLQFTKNIRYKDGYYHQCKLCFGRKYGAKYKKSHPWYMTLCAIRQRCNYKKNCNYQYYGGKGVKCLLTIKDIKSLWRRDKAFNLKKPSIDRINSKGDYTLTNCRFIEHSENISRKWL